MIGESNRQSNLWIFVRREPCSVRIQHDCIAVVDAETDNAYDTKAVSVWFDELQATSCPATMPPATRPAW